MAMNPARAAYSSLCKVSNAVPSWRARLRVHMMTVMSGRSFNVRSQNPGCAMAQAMTPVPRERVKRLLCPLRQTRQRRIDPGLRAAGWAVVDYEPARSLEACDGQAVREYPTETGPADYALCVDGRVLGVVEAKRVSVGPQNVLSQAAEAVANVART